MTRTASRGREIAQTSEQATPSDASVRKYFVLDTNVLLHNPSAIFMFAEHEVVIPLSVIEELDTFKGNTDANGRNARQIIRELDRLRKKGRLFEGVPVNELGGTLHSKAELGLSDFGAQVVAEVAKRGMVLDVAHSSQQVVRDVLAMTDMPIVVSHTGLNSHCETRRNYPDDLMRDIVATGGVIGIGFWANVICDDGGRSTFFWLWLASSGWVFAKARFTSISSSPASVGCETQPLVSARPGSCFFFGTASIESYHWREPSRRACARPLGPWTRGRHSGWRCFPGSVRP